jgi:predicted DNA-binding transcriptional regulator YafY
VRLSRRSSARAPTGEVTGFTGSVEILEPDEIRELLTEIARELGRPYA